MSRCLECEYANNIKCFVDRDSCPIYNNISKVVSVVIHTTDRCNENCSFCWHKDKIEFMDKDMDRPSIDLLINYLKRDYEDYAVSVVFTGGEPSLNLDIIDYMVSEIKRNFKYYNFTLITNGIEYIDNEKNLNYNAKILVSLPKFESESFDIRLKNVKNYMELEKLNGKIVIFMITLRPEDYPNVKEIFTFWKSIGINSMNILFEYHEYDTIDIDNISEEEYYQEFKIMMDTIKSTGIESGAFTSQYKPYVLDTLITNWKQPFFSYFKDGSMHLSTRGKFFNNTPIGYIDKGIDIGKAFDFYKDIKCYTCDIRNACKADMTAFMHNDKYVDNNSICLLERSRYRYNILERGESTDEK